MGAFFTDTLWSLFTRPEIRIVGKGLKLAAQGLASADAKAEYAKAETTDFQQLLDRVKTGDSNAQFELACYCAEQEDYKNALYWLEASARRGNTRALELLSHLQD